MSHTNYTLEIISNHPEFKNKSLRKYNVDGIETVGAWGDEPFEIKFKNNTWQKVQVKLSLDGTDILTGAPATTEVNKDMWVVNGYATLTLKAWPETSHGGSQFVFTSADKSVAVNTHGDLSSRGIIAAAVYTEGHVEPVRLNNYPNYNWNIGDAPIFGGAFNGGTFNVGQQARNNLRRDLISETICSSDTKSYDSDDLSFSDSRARGSKSLESLVSVGAGQHVNQKITYVTGLVKPLLTETVKVRYLWWDELKSKLTEYNVPAPHPSGFPGDREQNIMSIGNTPKIGCPVFKRVVAPPVYSRF